MIRNYSKSLALLFFALPITSTNALAQTTCVVSGATLTEARSNYNQQCTLERVDCDPFNGEWICASFRMNSAEPPALTVAQITPAQPTPAPEPTPTPEPTPAPQPSPAPEPAGPDTATPDTVSTARPTCVSANSDPDGDGFGWENSATCIVAPGSILTPPAESTTPAEETASTSEPTPARPDCLRADSDPDGDGFGWENNQTCLVTDASTVDALRSEPANDSSNTNTGNSNGNTTVTAADITDLILVTGQSNALGAGTAFNATLDAPNSRVFAFTNNGWQVANLNQIWDLNWHPRNHPNTDPSNNFSIHFGKTVAENDSAKVIGFVLASAPGARIANWELGSGFYNEVQAKVLDAINQLPHKSAIDGILWHQGESDGVDEQYYTDALYTFISNLRSEPWVASNAPFICGETKIASVNNRLNGLNRDSDPNTACVQAIDLPTRGDNRHFNAEGLRTLGARYGRAYLNIVN